MVAPPRVNLRGVVTTADPRKLSVWAEREIGWVLENRWNQLARPTGGTAPDVDWVGVQREVELGLQRRLRRELQVDPLILCLVQPAPAGTPVYKGQADQEPDTRPAPRGGRREVGREAPAGVQRLTPAASNAPRPVATPAATATATVAVAVVESQAVGVTQAAPVEAEPEGRARRRRSAAVAG
jgi:ribonuclease J